jgi:hypothetical protein
VLAVPSSGNSGGQRAFLGKVFPFCRPISIPISAKKQFQPSDYKWFGYATEW